MTVDLDDRYSVTVRADGPRKAIGTIIDRSTQGVVHKVIGEGRVLSAAQKRAVAAARAWVLSN